MCFAAADDVQVVIIGGGGPRRGGPHLQRELRAEGTHRSVAQQHEVVDGEGRGGEERCCLRVATTVSTHIWVRERGTVSSILHNMTIFTFNASYMNMIERARWGNTCCRERPSQESERASMLNVT